MTTPIKHILVPTDFGDSSNQALDVAINLAQKFGAKLTLLHSSWFPPYYGSADAMPAWPKDAVEDREKKELDAALATARERYPEIVGAFTTGETWECILKESKDREADLIIMGTHGRHGLSRVLLGSVAEKVVRLSSIPVMIVPSEAERQEKAQGARLLD